MTQPTPEVIAQRRAEWASRLLSGEFYQIYGRLSDGGDGRCCLGVACDVAADEVGGEWFKIQGTFTSDEVKFSPKDDFGSSMVLPEPVRKWFDTSFANPDLFPNEFFWPQNKQGETNYDLETYSITLSFLNDEGVPWEIIARLITDWRF